MKLNNQSIMRSFVLLIIGLAIPLLATWGMVRYLNQDVFFEQKSNHLTFVAQLLEQRLDEGGYDEILKQANALDASREKRLAVLNDALTEITDEIASVGTGLGVGFYSRDLDAIVTYGPSWEFADNVGKSVDADHPGRRVMATNSTVVQTGAMVRGNIMNAMIPIVRGGQVIGYVWANELVSDLERMLQSFTIIVTVLLAVAYGIMVSIIFVFFRRLMRAEERHRQSLEDANRETQRVDGLMHVVNRAIGQLLSADEEGFEEVLQNSMQLVAEAFEVDRLFIWKQSIDGNLSAFRLEASFVGKNGSEFPHVHFDAPVLPMGEAWNQWVSKMQQNGTVNCARREGSEWMDEYGLQSLNLIPVFLQESFWGFVSVANCHNQRILTKDEEAILVSSGLLMGNAISRNDLLQRMRGAREEALAGTRAKSAFLASMSHEMRTPMNAIIGMAAIGKKATEQQRKDYAFSKIEGASEHLLGVINDVLDISKIESGKLELAGVEFVFEDMLRRVVNVTEGRFAEKNQTFMVRVDSAIPATLICDDQRLAQVITNLLSNAMKFTEDKGSIWLDAKLLCEKEDGLCTLQIDVSDTGIGLTEEQRLRIFDSFEQAEIATTRKYGGTGLGLSISKNLVALMGGKLWVQSELSKGSTFSFTIQAPKGRQKHSFSLPQGEDNGYRALVVDGNAQIREHLAQSLQAQGFACGTATQVETGLAMAQKEGPFDLCYVDIHCFEDMENISMIPFQALAKENRIVVTGSYVELAKISEAMEAEGAYTLTKPFLPSDIIRSIDGLLGGRKANESLYVTDESIPDFTGRCILLAEDVEINGEILMSLLEPTGIMMEWALNGEEAVFMYGAGEKQYDLVFMDIQMPRMDGYEATRRIRAMNSPRAKTVPIIAMTANVFREDIQACRQAGMNDHIGKPINPRELLRKLEMYLEVKQ